MATSAHSAAFSSSASSGVHAVAGEGDEMAVVRPAEGEKCARCWKVLPEVGTHAAHPGLCGRCADAVDSGLVCKAV